MKKVLEINGMSCSHCEGKVSQALNALPGVEAVVSHKKSQAVITVTGDASDDALRNAVKEAGYEPGALSEKKGLFGIL